MKHQPASHWLTSRLPLQLGLSVVLHHPSPSGHHGRDGERLEAEIGRNLGETSKSNRRLQSLAVSVNHHHLRRKQNGPIFSFTLWRTLQVKMNTTWGFLTPWYTVLCRHLFKWEGSSFPRVTASVLTPSLRDEPQWETLFVTRLPFDPETSRDRVQLQRLRESFELFSLLAMANNAVFIKLMDSYMDSRSRNRFSSSYPNSYCQPNWGFWFEGALSHRGIVSSTQSPFTWGSLLGFPDDPWEYSQEFYAAVQKLGALGMDVTSRARLRALSTVRWKCWKCAFAGLRILGRRRICERPNSRLVAAQSFFDTGVPLHFQICVGLDTWRHTDTQSNAEMFWYTQTDVLEAVVHIPATAEDVSRDVTEVKAAVGQAALSSLILEAIGKAHRFDYHVEVNGVSQYLRVNYQPKEETKYLSRLHVACPMQNIEVHSSLCTAVAEASSAGHLNIFFGGDFKQMTGPVRWSWFIYAVLCGGPSVSRNSVSIWGSLTSEDVVMIQEVLRRNYPQPALQQSQHRPPEYGVMDIQKGAQLSGRNGIRLEITRALRCRALYCPDTMGDTVEVVVPGYGICTTKIEDVGNNFVSDAVCPSLPSGQLKSINSLTLHLTTLESEDALTQLLRLIGGSLRSLSLESRRQQIDLCVLATTCPELEKLKLKFYDVRVSTPNEALRQWAIKDISLYCVEDVSAMVTCLTDATLRMRKTLVRLDAIPILSHPLWIQERLRAFNGEFLPVTKEKLPKQSKAAVLSAVRSGCLQELSGHRAAWMPAC